MKLIIDTTKKDNVDIKCEEFSPYELGLVLGKYIECVAVHNDISPGELKCHVAQIIKMAMFKSDEEAEIKSIKHGEGE